MFAGLGTMILLMVANTRLLKWVKISQKANLSAKDDRVNAVSEALSSMRAIKVLALEPHFVGKVHALPRAHTLHAFSAV